MITQRWDGWSILRAVEARLHAAAAEGDLAQEVYGIDALDELGLHPIIQHGLREAGFGVWPEQRYPDQWHRSRRSEGQRCDIALTPDGLPLRDPDLRNTLFGQQPATDPEHAYWLEIKAVAQFEPLGPAPHYSKELLSPVADDVKKLWQDPIIRHAGLLIVLFTAEQAVAEHDLAAWHEHCLAHGYPVRSPFVTGFALNDRIGNAWAGLALVPVGED